MKWMWVFVAAGLLAVGSVHAGDAARLTVDVGNAFTLGEFTYDDNTIEVDSEMFNPRARVEFQFGGTPLAFGGEYLKSENTFSGEYDEGNGDAGIGDLEVERNEFAFYLKLIPSYNFSVRFGYRNFEYDISNANITQWDDGVISEQDLNGIANAKLATGVDSQIDIIIGSPTSVNLALILGYTYFIDGEYDWEYDEVIGGVTTHRVGSATADAHSIRVKPELSIPLSENLRLYVNGEVGATAWDADVDDDEPAYPGYDIFMAATAGLRYGIDLR
jgi:hypothetical protein